MISKQFSAVIGILILSLTKNGLSSYTFKTEYFDCKLDHFSFSSNRTFKLRYLINDTYWSSRSNAPIFFYTGNEGNITLFAQNTGFMWEIAAEFKALVVFAEHRYYGESLPFGTKSFEPQNIGYLSSSQALMDYVELIAFLKQDHKKHPVVAFGGSYGGMLAAWLRLKYPASVVGSIASSAPIWQFTGMTPCEAFNRVLTSAYTLESPHCSKNIKKSWGAIDNITETDDGKAWLSATWKLCEPLKTSTNVSNLKNYLINVYGNLAMINYPYPTDFLAPVPGHPVKVFCSHLLERSLVEKDLLTSLFGAITVYFNYTGEAKCLDYTDAYTQALDDNTWEYQACTEMVMPMCTNGNSDMFEPDKWNFTDYEANCQSTYEAKPQENLVKHLYGGKDISTASNIIFSNGLLDPWSSGGVLKNVSPSAVAVLMPEAAHHLDLRASHPDDPPSVVRARDYYRYTINQWISE